MYLAWLLFPLVLLLVSAGLGLGIARLVGGLPRNLGLPLGFAAAIVICSLLTAKGSTASAATPAVIALAITGALVGRDRRSILPERSAAFAALGAFLVFGAPALLSGQGTFAGFIRLDDTATWWALADQAFANGREIPSSMADPSTFARVLEDYVPGGYPFGAFLPLGLGHELTFEQIDLAFGFQPTLALLAGLLALTLTEVTRPLVAAARSRALIGFVAAQGTLLFSYAQWGAIKEVTGALLVALVAATAQTLRPPAVVAAEPAAEEAKPSLKKEPAPAAKPVPPKAKPVPPKAKGKGAAPSRQAERAKQRAEAKSSSPYRSPKPVAKAGSSRAVAAPASASQALTLPPVVELLLGADERPSQAHVLDIVRRSLPLAIAGAAVAAALSVGGAVWALPIALLSVLGSRPGPLRLGIGAVTAIAVAALLSIPSLSLYETFVKPQATSGSVLRLDTELGNLVKPLKSDQGLGIWLSGDFRFPPNSMWLTTVLLVLLVSVAIVGVGLAVWKRGGGVLGYAAGGVFACLYIVSKGSPWVDGKALATASPMVLTAALTAVAMGWAAKPEAVKAVAVGVGSLLAVGVLWSNALVYGESFVAPQAQLSDLHHIGDMLDGEGPTLMNEYEPYGARHFLRNAAAEGASERRVRPITLRDGQQVAKSGYADVGDFDPTQLRDYRSLVLRRDPLGSRPPSIYSLRWTGKAYSVWQRSPGPNPGPPAGDIPLGNQGDPAAVPDCASVRTLAEQAGADGTLVFVRRAPIVNAGLSAGPLPAGWVTYGDPRYAYPQADGTLEIVLTVPVTGRYRVWLGGSSQGTTKVTLDGKSVGSVRGVLNNQGGYVELDAKDLSQGAHTARVTYSQGTLRPGSRGQAKSPLPLGPLVLAPAAEPMAVESVPTSQASTLCGQRLDWIEAHTAGT